MKQQIISLLERAKENGRTIGDVLAQVRGMCQDCTQHAESKLEWITTPDIRDVPDCVLTPSGIALKQSQISAQDGRTQVDNDLVSSLLRIAEVAPASECEILQAAAAALASAPVAGEAQSSVRSLQRYGFGYADDGNGGRYLSSLKRDDGAFLLRGDVIAALASGPAAQPPQDSDVEMVSMGGTAPAVPRWLLDAAQRIQTYMDAHSPGAWAVGGIQKRQAPAAVDAAIAAQQHKGDA